MKQKLKELAEILKTNSAIKERLEELSFGCWLNNGARDAIILGKDYDDETGFNGRYRFIDDGENIFTDILFFKIIIGHTPQFSDVLEFLGEDYWMNKSMICENYPGDYDNLFLCIKLSPGPLSSQSDETLDEIISLCKSKN